MRCAYLFLVDISNKETGCISLCGGKTELGLEPPRSRLLLMGALIPNPQPLMYKRDLPGALARAGGSASFGWIQEGLRSGTSSSCWRKELLHFLREGLGWGTGLIDLREKPQLSGGNQRDHPGRREHFRGTFLWQTPKSTRAFYCDVRGQRH